MNGLMVLGTASDSGKTIICTAHVKVNLNWPLVQDILLESRR